MDDFPLIVAGPGTPGLVSVIVPTYNRARLVRSAVESILAQSYGRFEIVVVDDGSTDGTQDALAGLDPRLVYLRQDNAGASAARNRGLRAARGEFIAFLDSDDTWLPWKLEAQVRILARFPEAGLCWTDMSAVDQDGRITADRYLRHYYSAYDGLALDQVMPQMTTLGHVWAGAPAEVRTSSLRVGHLFSQLVLGNLVHTSTVLARRSFLVACGGFDVSLPVAEDYELWLRGSRKAIYALCDVPTIHYKIGGSDQLSSPSRSLLMAEANRRIVTRWVAEAKDELDLAPRTIRHRLARVHAWAGEERLLGGRKGAGRELLASLRHRPLQPRVILLVGLNLLPGGLITALRLRRRRLRNWAKAILGLED